MIENVLNIFNMVQNNEGVIFCIPKLWIHDKKRILFSTKINIIQLYSLGFIRL